MWHSATPQETLRSFGIALVLFLFGLIQAGDLDLLGRSQSGRRVGRRSMPRDPTSAPVTAPETGTPEAGTPQTGVPQANVAASGRRPRRRRRHLDVPVALTALALGGITFLASGGNRFTLGNVITWVASVAFALLAFWQPRPRLPGWRTLIARATQQAHQAGWGSLRAGLQLRLSWNALAFLAILTVGVGVLFFRLADVPKEMTSDHAEKLMDVADVLNGQHSVFFPRNTGREAFQFYWIAIMTPLAGVSHLTMKLGTALLASFTIPATFLFARVFFGTQLALVATAALVMARWHLQVARVGLRFPFPPLFSALTFYFLFNGIRDRRRNAFLLAGLALGISQHTYTALRLAPFGVAACLGIALMVDLWQRRSLSRILRLVENSILLFVITLLVGMPLLRYAVDNPTTFLYRGLTRMASDQMTGPPPNLPLIFLGNVKNALLMFNWIGDEAWINNIPRMPMLDPISGGLFFVGAVYLLYRILRYRELPYVYLGVTLFFGLLPSILSLAYPNENPGGPRTGMAMPATMVLVAIPVVLLAQRLRVMVGGAAGRALTAAALVVLFLAAFRLNMHDYFDVYGRTYAMASQHTTYAAQAVQGFVAAGGTLRDARILPHAHWMDTRLIAIELGDPYWRIDVDNIEGLRAGDGVPRVRLFLVHPDDRQAHETLGRWYPGAIRQTLRLADAGGNPWIVTYLIPPNTTAAR